MTDLPTLKSLISRVAAASGPDRELGARIICAVLAPAGSFVEQSPFNGAWCIYKSKDRLWEKPFKLRERDVTESIDAAVALIECVMPGWAWFVEKVDVDIHQSGARVWIPAQRTQGLLVEDAYCHDAVTPALALILALLSALISKTEASGAVVDHAADSANDGQAT